MENLTLFRLMDAKLAYASQRQGVLANNIANANTPGYKPYDVKTPDFKKIMAETADPAPIAMRGLTVTNGQHIAPLDTDDNASDNLEISTSYEISPDGNGVDIEEQMLKASKNNTDAGIVVGLYAKQLSFLRTAVGAGR